MYDVILSLWQLCNKLRIDCLWLGSCHSSHALQLGRTSAVKALKRADRHML